MPFNLFEFKKFCKRLHVIVNTTRPNYPQSNGMAERCVQIFKNILKKSFESRQDIWIFLLEYRNTPIKDIELTPNQLIMGRSTRSFIPGKNSIFYPMGVPNLENNYKIKTNKMKKYYDRKCMKEIRTLKMMIEFGYV